MVGVSEYGGSWSRRLVFVDLFVIALGKIISR
jgi:hypothetical protein